MAYFGKTVTIDAIVKDLDQEDVKRELQPAGCQRRLTHVYVLAVALAQSLGGVYGVSN